MGLLVNSSHFLVLVQFYVNRSMGRHNVAHDEKISPFMDLVGTEGRFKRADRSGKETNCYRLLQAPVTAWVEL